MQYRYTVNKDDSRCRIFTLIISTVIECRGQLYRQLISEFTHVCRTWVLPRVGPHRTETPNHRVCRAPAEAQAQAGRTGFLWCCWPRCERQERWTAQESCARAVSESTSAGPFAAAHWSRHDWRWCRAIKAK